MNPKVKLQGMMMEDKNVTVMMIYDYVKDLYVFLPEALDEIFEYNEPIQKEYAKNGKWFSSREQFFHAYISPLYKEILTDQKKNK